MDREQMITTLALNGVSPVWCTQHMYLLLRGKYVWSIHRIRNFQDEPTWGISQWRHGFSDSLASWDDVSDTKLRVALAHILKGGEL